MLRTNKKERMATIIGCGIVLAIILFAVLARQSSDPVPLNTVYTTVLDKRKVVAQMRIQLLQAVALEKNAVMALTDQQSREFADQSREAAQQVTWETENLAALLRTLPAQDEADLLNEFTGCWTELSQLDERILELAVANTNLKAMALSHTKGTALLRQFEEQLEQLRQASMNMPEQDRIAALLSRALIAGLKISNLHSAHITEAAREGMTKIEQQIETEAATVQQALVDLGHLMGQEDANLLQAGDRFTAFLAVTTEVLALSRQNSNLESLELSLGRKRIIAAQCDETLAQLQKILQKKPLQPTK